MSTDRTDPPPNPGYIPKPPSKAELDQISQEQGMITDEWSDSDTGGTGGKVDRPVTNGPNGGQRKP